VLTLSPVLPARSALPYPTGHRAYRPLTQWLGGQALPDNRWVPLDQDSRKSRQPASPDQARRERQLARMAAAR